MGTIERIRTWLEAIRAVREGLDAPLLHQVRYLVQMGIDPSDLSDRDVEIAGRLAETAAGLARDHGYGLDTAIHEVARATLHVKQVGTEQGERLRDASTRVRIVGSYVVEKGTSGDEDCAEILHRRGLRDRLEAAGVDPNPGETP